MVRFRLPRIRIDWSQETAAPLSTGAAVSSKERSQQETGDVERREPPPLPKPQRPIWVRLLSIRIGGLLNLLLWCLVLGLAMRFTGYNPFSPQPSGMDRASDMWRPTLQAAGAALQLGWKPVLTGAGVVLPVWIMWRILTLPFRR